jgi:hypothetical protein
MTHPIRILSTVIVAFALVAPTQAGAIVPAKNCGIIKVGGKRYQVKADQLTCTTAKKYATTLLRTKRRPTNYRCTKGSSGSKLVYNCVNTKASPDRTFYILRR